MSERLLTLAEAAECCACSAKTVRRAIDSGNLVAVRLGQSSKSDRIHPADLEDFWKRRRTFGIPIAPLAVAAVEAPADADARLAALFESGRNPRGKGRKRP